ncbi:hypothetical protein PF001_g22975 [Phytophthora fragariae]|uniref:Uncharacterized protein n=1 Tax=Phytophthora fragariae TaxID=53985 RepID=A0A6A4C9J7_9STRA|nr:hypothetical protein PF001_g22975 [Phytophthora fragariae]
MGSSTESVPSSAHSHTGTLKLACASLRDVAHRNVRTPRPVACCRGNGVPPAPPSRNPIPPTPASPPDFNTVRLDIYSLLTKSVNGLTSDSTSDGTLYKCALFVYAA